MPTVVIIAGPNGAGKTTFANAWFATQPEGWVFLNADEIAREPEVRLLPQGERDLRAGRLLLERLERLVLSGVDFGLETTLSSRLYARRVPAWRTRGYRIELVYLRLPDVESSIARVAARVATGGHGVPESDLRRRFERSRSNLERAYKPICDAWEVWDNTATGHILKERYVK